MDRILSRLESRLASQQLAPPIGVSNRQVCRYSSVGTSFMCNSFHPTPIAEKQKAPGCSEGPPLLRRSRRLLSIPQRSASYYGCAST